MAVVSDRVVYVVYEHDGQYERWVIGAAASYDEAIALVKRRVARERAKYERRAGHGQRAMSWAEHVSIANGRDEGFLVEGYVGDEVVTTVHLDAEGSPA